MSECRGWDDNRCCAGNTCAPTCACTGDPATCRHQTLRRDRSFMRRYLQADARDEARAMEDRQLATFCTYLRRLLVMADEDGLPDWMESFTCLRLEAAEKEWDWRKRAEARGGPRVPRENWRDKLERLRERHPIETVASKWTALTRAGRELKGLCPIHQESTPSFYVSPDKGVWHCHGCNNGGDVFTLVEMLETGEFVAAVKWLEGAA